MKRPALHHGRGPSALRVAAGGTGWPPGPDPLRRLPPPPPPRPESGPRVGGSRRMARCYGPPVAGGAVGCDRAAVVRYPAGGAEIPPAAHSWGQTGEARPRRAGLRAQTNAWLPPRAIPRVPQTLHSVRPVSVWIQRTTRVPVNARGAAPTPSPVRCSQLLRGLCLRRPRECGPTSRSLASRSRAHAPSALWIPSAPPPPPPPSPNQRRSGEDLRL